MFKVKLNEVQYKELPVADDEFAKDVSDDTLTSSRPAFARTWKNRQQAELAWKCW
ncbi:MAG: hypothetical protein ACLRWF_04685 [Ruthenibacterium sp.]